MCTVRFGSEADRLLSPDLNSTGVCIGVSNLYVSTIGVTIGDIAQAKWPDTLVTLDLDNTQVSGKCCCGE